MSRSPVLIETPPRVIDLNLAESVSEHDEDTPPAQLSDEELARRLQEEFNSEMNWGSDRMMMEQIHRYVSINHLSPDAAAAAFSGEDDEMAALRRMQEEEFGVLGIDMRAHELPQLSSSNLTAEDMERFVAAAQGQAAREDGDVIALDDPDAESDIDVDAMSYEELLELGERMGKVSVGVPRVVLDRVAPRCPFDVAGAGAEAEDCRVCLTALESKCCSRHLPCGHCFHSECVERWLSESKKCPQCLTEVTVQQKDFSKAPTSDSTLGSRVTSAASD